MKAIILSAERGIRRVDATKSYPYILKSDPQGKRILEWLSLSLQKCGFRDIVIVGGYHIEKIIQEYPQFRYYYNPRWKDSGSLASLFSAETELSGPCLISKSNVVYHSDVVDKMISTAGDVVVGVVPAKTFSPYSGNVADSEKVFLSEGNFLSPVPIRRYAGETYIFSGIIFLTETGVRKFSEKARALLGLSSLKDFNPSADHQYVEIHEVIMSLLDSDFQARATIIDEGLAWIDDSFSFSQFILGTKAQTLENLRGKLRHAQVLEQIRFSREQWEDRASEVLEEVQRKFGNEKIIIRSSAIEEDSWTQSHAGKFLSEESPCASDTVVVKSSVSMVIQCLEEKGKNRQDQILIQPFLKNVTLSGVLFTRDIETGAPYIVINYDMQAGITNGVTSGAADRLSTCFYYKKVLPADKEDNHEKILKMAAEIEQLIGHDALDVEFAIDGNGTCYLFQVRPIVFSHREQIIDEQDFDEEIGLIKQSLRSLLKKRPFVFGQTTIFSNMSDWNPAEMIGVSPRPLALSLYKYLITDYVWARGRAVLGYRNVYPNPLMYSFAGHPYIDVRASFNSFLPEGLPSPLSEKLVDYYVEELRRHPEFHDKVEFEIAITCYTLDFDFHAARLRRNGFSDSEIECIRKGLVKLTNHIIGSQETLISKQLHAIQTLRERAVSISNAEVREIEEMSAIIGYYLDDCILFGTLPFSILARFAFIATAFLKSFQRLEIFSHEEIDRFLMSIPTVATDLAQSLEKLNCCLMSKDVFLEKFGHLRPGTYDILSPRYNDAFDTYFSRAQRNDSTIVEDAHKVRSMEDIPTRIFMEKKKEISRLLQESGLEFSSETLLQFIVQSIRYREMAKFEFTKHISSTLKWLDEFSRGLGITKEDISYLPIRDVLDFKNRNLTCSFRRDILKVIESNKKAYKITCAIRLPGLILSDDDVDFFQIHGEIPNFITNKKVTAPLLDMDSSVEKDDLTEKIVLVEKADPGYDWIFGHSIAGLITKYGGVASHMAIRAAEFGLPAAIGCGELIFSQLKKASIVELNCATRQINVIE